MISNIFALSRFENTECFLLDLMDLYKIFLPAVRYRKIQEYSAIHYFYHVILFFQNLIDIENIILFSYQLLLGVSFKDQKVCAA